MPYTNTFGHWLSQNGHQPTPNEDCVKVRDFLPFYIAGTLHAGDHAKVQTHLTACENCRTLVAAWESVAQVVRAEAEIRVGLGAPILNVKIEPERHRGHREPMTSYSGGYDHSFNNTTHGKNTRKSARRYGLMTGLVAMAAALMLMSIQIIGRVMPLGQYAAPNPTASVLSLFDDLQPITSENADQLQIINRFGRGTVQDIDWSPDGTTLAIASTTGVYLYSPDAETPERDSDSPYVTQKLGVSSAKITALDYSPDGQRLAVVADAQLQVWDAVTGETVGEFDEMTNLINAEFSPDGETLLLTTCAEPLVQVNPGCQSELQILSVITVADGEQTASWPGLIDPQATFSPDGQEITLTSWNQTDAVTAVSVATIQGQSLASFTLDTEDVSGLYYSLDGTHLAVLYTILDSAIGTTTRVSIFEVMESSVESRASFSVERSIHGFEFTKDGQSIRYMTNWLSPVEPYSVYKIRTVDGSVQTQIRFEEEKTSFMNVAVNPQIPESLFATYDSRGTISLWEITGETVLQIDSVSEFLYSPLDIVFSPSPVHKPFIIFRNASQIEIWDYISGQRQAYYNTREPFIYPHRKPVFSVDGVLGFTLPYDPLTVQTEVGLWDVASGFRTKTLNNVASDVLELGFTPDGKILAIGTGGSFTTGVWQEKSDGTYRFSPLRGIDMNRRGGLFSEDGTVLAFTHCLEPNEGYACQHKTGLSIYETNTGERLLQIEPDLSFSPGSSMTQRIDQDHAVVVMAACADATEDLDERETRGRFDCYGTKLIAWDVSGVLDGTTDQPRELFALESDLEYLGPIAIDPDAQLIAARMEADTFSIISIESGEIIATIPFHERGATLAFNDDGTLLAVGGEGTITLYGVPTEQQ